MQKIEVNRNERVRRTVRSGLAIIALLALLAVPALAQSQGGAGKTDDWQFTAAPHLILPWMNGTTAVRGFEADVNVNPSDIFSNLQIGAMGYFEARKARWAFGVDALYMALGTSVDQPPLNIDVNQGAYTFVGMRQVHENVDVLFGARWNVLQGKLSFKEPPQIVDAQIKQAIDSQLASKGLSKTDGDQADLFVGYQIAVDKERQWNAISMGPVRFGGMGTATSSTINIGTLVLDMYDAKTKQPIWRGDATKAVDPSKDPQKNQKDLEKSVAKLLKNYPPPAK
jgi:hypothetical protein